MKKDYKLKKLFALFLAVAGILGIAMVGNAQDEAGKIFVKKTATKIYDATAKDNLEKGRFAKVNLSVNANPYNASVTTNGKLDIVLIFDSSNSMDEPSGTLGETRMQAAKKAATDFANTLMDDKGTVKIGIVEFGTRVLDVQEMTTEKETVKKFIKNKLDLPEKYNDGGTNLQAAIERADTVLNNGKRKDAKQIVIVLTDGIPTYFTYNNNIYGTGQNDDKVAYNCYGNYCDWQRPSDAALKAMNKLKRNHSTSDVYTILFGNDTSATATLKKINPEQTKPLYKNYNALTGEDLKKMFETLSSQLMNIIGKDSVVTDIIPKEFMLTETSKNKLIEQGVEVKENREDGTTELIWKIGNIEANKEISLTYEVKAKDEYHGSIFTNQNATLKTTVEENNPYYKNQPSTQTIVFEKPTVEIPAITNSDHYKDNSSYIGYAENVINGTSILNNDLDKIIKNDKTKENDVVIVKDEIVINETENVTKVNEETNKYQITKDGVLQGILTINEDGTFTFAATKNASGEIEFTYHIKSTINSHHETEFVYSNDSTVTLLVKERQTKSITGEKVWLDNNNNDNSRPESITVKLFANEKEVKSLKVTKETVAANNPNTWLYEFKNLYMYEVGHENEDNYLINYTVKEEKVPGYTTKITGTTITNTHDPITIDIVGEKVWLDNNNNDNSRPESITVKLFANEKEVKSLKVTKETVAANNPNTWLYEFKDLPKYENGKEINYTVKEEKVNNYETSYNKNNKFVIINTHENEQIKLSGTKTWNDNNNQDGIRPTSIKVTLIGRVGEKTVYTSEKIEVSADTNWTYEFEKLDKFYEGKEIIYSVIEENVKGYSVKYNGLDIINTHIPEVISITGEKVWVDGDNQDGIRPEKITVILNKTVAGNTTKVAENIVEEDETGNWTFTFENLPKYENGTEIIYTLEEVDVNGYTSKIKDYKITNTHAPETVTFNIVKEWYDYENNDGIRPNSITVRIKADHEEVAQAILSEENNWNAIFENLPKYKNGIEINYEIVEDEVEGYTPTISNPIKENDNNVTVEDEVEGYTPTISNPIKENDNNVTVVIKNTHEKETTEIVIEKVWDDVGNENKRPDFITVNIYANGELFETVKITAENNWQLKLENLQKYFSGEEIIYTIEEVELEDYVTDYEGYTIINSYKAKGEITPPNTGIMMNTNSKNLYIETLTLLLGTISITYIFKKREN